MLQLNYTSYVIQAGDWGGIVLRYLAGQHPANVVSALSNFFVVAPNATDLERYYSNLTTPDETAYIAKVQTYGNNSGYRLLMGETPLQVVDGMTDSPMGNLAFEWTTMKQLSDPAYEWTLEEIITWTMMYWIPGPYASMRHYREMALEGVFAGTGLGNVYPYVEVPVGLSEWPGDFWYRLVSEIYFSVVALWSWMPCRTISSSHYHSPMPFQKRNVFCIFSYFSKHSNLFPQEYSTPTYIVQPLDWGQRYANVTSRVVHDVGAHFPAVQNTDLLVQDIRSFFGNTSLSNTGLWLD